MNEAKPIRVLHVFGVMDRGGAEIRTLELMRGLDREAIQFEFASLLGIPGELDEEIQRLGGKVHPIGWNGLLLWRLWRLFSQGGFEVLHSHVHYFSAAVLLLGWMAGIAKRIAHFRSTADGRPDRGLRWVRNRIFRELLHLVATDIVGVSEACLDQAIGPRWRADEHCQVIYSGVDVQRFQWTGPAEPLCSEFGFAAGTRVVIHIGRMVPEKNHVRVMRIFAEWKRTQMDLGLLLVGKRNPDMERDLLRYAKEAGVLDSVRIVGVREEVSRLLAGAEMMLFPSLREGLPGAVIEALAAGVPVVASRIPGIAELEGRFEALHLMDLDQPDTVWVAECRATLERGRARGTAMVPEDFDSAKARTRFEHLYRSNPVGRVA